MHRRTLLGVLAVGGAGALSAQSRPFGQDRTRGDGEDGSVTTNRMPSIPVPLSELVQAVPPNGIPAIVEPAFAPDWSGVAVPAGAEFQSLPDRAPVIGVDRLGQARAYPLLLLGQHEVVNDQLGGPLLVTFCPVCGSGVVAKREVTGLPTTFGVSGYLYRQNLVLFDYRTGSLWSQLLALAIRGPRTGDTLEQLPSTLTTWGEWRADHPNTVVLLPPPKSTPVHSRVPRSAYFRSAYLFEDGTSIIGKDGSRSGISENTLVIGVRSGGVARAYPQHIMESSGVVNDTVGGRPIVVTTTPDGGLAAYDRRVSGHVLTFAPAGPRQIRSRNTCWDRKTGQGVSGRYTGKALVPANDHEPMLWIGWRNFNPNTEIYGLESRLALR